MQMTDQTLILSIKILTSQGLKNINVCLFDTPLQLSYKFCQENKIPISEFKKISKKISEIIKSALDNNIFSEERKSQVMESFAKYFIGIENSQTEVKDFYTIEEMLETDCLQSSPHHQHHCNLPAVQEVSSQGTSHRSEHLSQLQQKIYQMYILSPDNNKEDRISGRETEATSAPRDSVATNHKQIQPSHQQPQLEYLQSILEEHIRSVALKNQSIEQRRPSLFNQDNEQPFQMTKVSPMTTSVKKQTLCKSIENSGSKRTTVKKVEPQTKNKQQQNKQWNNNVKTKNTQSPLNSKKQQLQCQVQIKPRDLNKFSNRSQSPQNSFASRPGGTSISGSSLTTSGLRPSTGLKINTAQSRSKSPNENLSQSRTFSKNKGLNLQTTPEKKVRYLLSKLIYGKKASNSPNVRSTPKSAIQKTNEIKKCQTLENEWDSKSQKEELENLKSEQLYKVFQSLDSDRDGFISPDKIELSSLSDEILSYLVQMLYEIDNKKLVINFRQFCFRFQLYLQKMNEEQLLKFLHTKVNL